MRFLLCLILLLPFSHAQAVPFTPDDIPGFDTRLNIVSIAVTEDLLFLAATDPEATDDAARVRFFRFNTTNDVLFEIVVGTSQSRYASARLWAGRGHLAMMFMSPLPSVSLDYDAEVWSLPAGQNRPRQLTSVRLGQSVDAIVTGFTTRRVVIVNTLGSQYTAANAYRIDGTQQAIGVPLASPESFHFPFMARRNGIYAVVERVDAQGQTTCTLRRLGDQQETFENKTVFSDGSPCPVYLLAFENAIYAFRNRTDSAMSSCEIWRMSNTGTDGQVMVNLDDVSCVAPAVRRDGIQFEVANLSAGTSEYWTTAGTPESTVPLDNPTAKPDFAGLPGVITDIGIYYRVFSEPPASPGNELWFHAHGGAPVLLDTPVGDWGVIGNTVWFLGEGDDGATILCREALVIDEVPDEPRFPRIITTPDREAPGNYAWLLYQTGERQWIDAVCRNDLVLTGVTTDVLDWARISQYPEVASSGSCKDLSIPDNDREILVTPDRLASGNYGWVRRSNGTRQWIDAACRDALEGRGYRITSFAWSQIIAIPDSTLYLSCDAL